MMNCAIQINDHIRRSSPRLCVGFALRHQDRLLSSFLHLRLLLSPPGDDSRWRDVQAFDNEHAESTATKTSDPASTNQVRHWCLDS